MRKERKRSESPEGFVPEREPRQRPPELAHVRAGSQGSLCRSSEPVARWWPESPVREGGVKAVVKRLGGCG